MSDGLSDLSRNGLFGKGVDDDDRRSRTGVEVFYEPDVKIPLLVIYRRDAATHVVSYSQENFLYDMKRGIFDGVAFMARSAAMTEFPKNSAIVLKGDRVVMPRVVKQVTEYEI